MSRYIAKYMNLEKSKRSIFWNGRREYVFDKQGRCCFSCKDGNGSGSVRVEYLGTQNRNPNLKPEPDPNSNSGTNSNPKPKPADTRNRTDNPKPEFFFKPAMQASNTISSFQGHSLHSMQQYWQT